MDWKREKLESSEETKSDSTSFEKEVERVFMKIYLVIISKTLSGQIKVL